MKPEPERIEDQIGPCGIVCKTCPLGSGTVAEGAAQTMELIKSCKISEWAPFVSEEGREVDWSGVVRGLEWMTKYAFCVGCESGGGPPDCPIRICARNKGLDLCSSCSEIEWCDNFDWLADHGQDLKERLKTMKGVSKEEYLKSAKGSMPWEE